MIAESVAPENIPLIAAAPDLLAFAEAFRMDLQARGLRESDLDAHQMALLNQADAAIAKATSPADPFAGISADFNAPEMITGRVPVDPSVAP